MGIGILGPEKCGAMRDLVLLFIQFKKHEKHPWRSVFHVFQIVQMLPNRATHHICLKMLRAVT